MEHRCSHPDGEFKATDRTNAIVPQDGCIYWHIDEEHITPDMDKFKVILAFEKAFNAWQPHFSPLKLKSTSKKWNAPIVIRFMQNGHKDLPSPFSPSTLAYAYYPYKGSLGIHSDMYFNERQQWAEMHSVKHINLWKVAVHELGHAFGIGHTDDIEDIMYPIYQPDDNINITQDTADAIDYLYEQYRGPRQDAPEVPFDLKRYLAKLFPGPKRLEALTDRQLVRIGQTFRLNVNIDYNKVDNLRTVYEFLHGAK